MRRRRQDEADNRELAELAALADGSLAPERRAAVEARVAADPELADRLAEQRRAIALAQSAAAEVEAPPALRARIERRPRARRAPMRRVAWFWLGVGAASWSAVAVGAARCRLGHVGRALPRRPRSHRARARRRRRGDADQDSPRAGGSSSTPPGFPAARAGSSTRRGCAIAAGVLVPIGTFNEGRKVTLWAGVSPKDYPDADRHARAGRRRSGLVRREGARRNGDRPRLARVASGQPPSTRRTTCWRAR